MYLLIVGLVVGVLAVGGYVLYKRRKAAPQEIKTEPDTNLFNELNEINIFVRKNVTDSDVLDTIEGLVDSCAVLYDEVLKLQNDKLVLGPKFQLERTVTKHLNPYIQKFVDAKTADKKEFIDGLSQIKSDVDETYQIVKDNKLNEFEMNHTFINMKY